MAATPGDASATKGAITKPLPSGDALTQILMALYFFLAGAAVSTSSILLILPLATFLSALVFALNSVAAPVLFKAYGSLTPDRAALWNLQATHLVYSTLAAVCAVLYVVSHPAALRLSEPQPEHTLPRALAAASSGFFGFVLWTEVNARLYKRSYTAVVHYTVLLVLFLAAAHKSVNTPFLSVTLVAEINSICRLVRRQLGLLGVPSQSKRGRLLATADNVTFVACRLVPHAALGAMVAVSPQAFASPATYWLATAGMAYMNAVNVRHALLGRSNMKEHAA